ncbi:MAG: class I SAM-dependent methyltransferase [Planctomycetaceae bacterium]|nr:class I SAM-dependent methyltransferase [Planctomycetaceae bacterium]
MSRDELKSSIAEELCVKESDFELEFDTNDHAAEIKMNLETGKQTKYTFYYARIVFHEKIEHISKDIVIIGKNYCWKTIKEIKEHSATKALNIEAFNKLIEFYGGDELTEIRDSLLSPICESCYPCDPYEDNAKIMNNLPWFKDKKLFASAIPTELLRSVSGIVDFGCGTGRLGHYVTEFLKQNPQHCIDYIGIDKSSSMIEEVKRHLDSGTRSKFMIKDILDNNWANFELLRQTSNYLFVFKNVLQV